MVKKFSVTFIFLTAVLSLAFFTFLFLAVRPDPDDMIISLDLREHSLWYVLQTRYFFSSFRTTLLVLDQWILGYKNTDLYLVSIPVFYFSLFALLIFALYKLFSETFLLSLNTLKEKMLLVLFSITQAAAIYFLCSSRIELFGWIAATEAHLVPLVFLLLAAWLVIKRVRKKTDHVFLFICALVIAGGAEHISVCALTGGIAISILAAKSRISISGQAKKKLIFFTTALCILFACIFSNPGTWHRFAEVEGVIKAQEVARTTAGEGFISMFFHWYKFVGLLLAFGGCFCFLKIFNGGSHPLINFKWLLLLACGAAFVCMLMSFAVYKTISLGRVWFPLDVAMYLLFFSLALHLGQKNIFQTPVYIAVSLLGFTAVLVHDVRHIPALSDFSTSYNKIVKNLEAAEPGETIVIAQFPSPDLVNMVELQRDENHEMNRLFCRFYNARAKISVTKNK